MANGIGPSRRPLRTDEQKGAASPPEEQKGQAPRRQEEQKGQVLRFEEQKGNNGNQEGVIFAPPPPLSLAATQEAAEWVLLHQSRQPVRRELFPANQHPRNPLLGRVAPAPGPRQGNEQPASVPVFIRLREERRSAPPPQVIVVPQRPVQEAPPNRSGQAPPPADATNRVPVGRRPR